MESQKNYHYVRASGLVRAELLNELFQNFESGVPLSAKNAANLIDRTHLQHPARLRYGHRRLESETEKGNAADSSDASLDDDTSSGEQNLTTSDRAFTEELVQYGWINRWQSQQLLKGRTKFTLGGYRILDAIGHGGYGHVFLGRGGEGYVALKVLPLNRATPELTERFLHEIDVQKFLFHPNIVRFFGSGRDGNVHYMVHEFVNGGDLRELFFREGTLPIEVVAAILGQIARGVHFLHENGIIHRDIKPANVLLADDGTARLTDMGLALSFDGNLHDPQQMFDDGNSGGSGNFLERQIDTAAKPAGKIAGTIDYMAPDQIRHPTKPSPSWDIYSLGCTLYQMLTGSVPYPNGDTKQKLRDRIQFEPKDPRILNQAIPFDLVDLLRGMLAQNPFHRIRTAKEVARRLDAWTPPDGLKSSLCFEEQAG